MKSTYVNWIVDEHLILLQSPETVTLEELMQTDSQVIDMFEKSSKPLIHIIIDVPDEHTLPGLKGLSQITFIKHPKMGYALIIGGNVVSRMFGQIVGSAAKIRIRFFKTMDEALEFLPNVDTTLPNIDTLKENLSTISKTDT